MISTGTNWMPNQHNYSVTFCFFFVLALFDIANGVWCSDAIRHEHASFSGQGEIRDFVWCSQGFCPDTRIPIYLPLNWDTTWSNYKEDKEKAAGACAELEKLHCKSLISNELYAYIHHDRYFIFIFISLLCGHACTVVFGYLSKQHPQPISNI